MIANKTGKKAGPPVVSMLSELVRLIGKAMGSAPQLTTLIPGLTLYKNTIPTAPNPCTYEPSLLVVAQGQKRVDLGKESFVFGETTFLLTSIELPIVSRVCAASAERPYLAFFLKLDMGIVSFSIVPRIFRSLAKCSSERSSTGFFRERRGTASVPSQRWLTKTIEQPKQWLGCVTTS